MVFFMQYILFFFLSVYSVIFFQSHFLSRPGAIFTQFYIYIIGDKLRHKKQNKYSTVKTESSLSTEVEVQCVVSLFYISNVPLAD